MGMDKSESTERVREVLGRIYNDVPGHFKEYIRRYREDPTSRVFAPLAEAYRRLGRLDEAIELCKQGLRHHPDFQGGRMALARCYLDKKCYEDAKNELMIIIGQSPENLLAQKNLGEAFLALEDKQRALHHLKMASLLAPNDVSLAEKVHGIEIDLANCVAVSPIVEGAQITEGPKTEDLLETVISEVGPNSGDSGRILPSIDMFFGKENDLEEEPFQIVPVNRIFSPNEEGEITTETLGDLYFAQGQYQKSLRIFDRLNERFPSPALAKKLDCCREKLGVDRENLIRNRKIETLQSILYRLREVRLSH